MYDSSVNVCIDEHLYVKKCKGWENDDGILKSKDFTLVSEPNIV